MRRMRSGWLAAGLLIAAGPALAQYEPPELPAEPGAQLAEMVALYDELCFQRFPDDAAVARQLETHQAVALTSDELRQYLHDDAGQGWRFTGRMADYVVTIENPPYHACTVRTMTPSGFADMSAYRSFADRYEAGRGFTAVAPLDRVNGPIHSRLEGDYAMTPDGRNVETLIVAVDSPDETIRAKGQTAVSVRFVRQFRSATTPP
jgi:hypothetical protein